MRPQRQRFDPRTEAILRAEQAPSRLVVFGLFSLVAGGLFAALHHELPFLAHWSGACSPADYAYECETRGFYDAVAGVAGTAVFGACAWLAHRLGPMRPTVTCTSCRTSGWVLDLEPHAGRCPRCGGDRFDYQIWFGDGTGRGPRIERFREQDVAGADLVRRFRETRKSSMRRYL
jgi:hypothetical protein